MCGPESDALKIAAINPDPPAWVIAVIQKRIRRKTKEFRKNKRPYNAGTAPIRFPTICTIYRERGMTAI